jgi:hypothetical protein
MRTITADLFVAKRAQVFGFQGAFGQLGSASGAGVATLVLSVATWRSAFLPIAGFFIIIGAVSHRWSNQPYVVKWVSIDVVDTGRRVFGDTVIRRTLVTYVLFIFMWQGVLRFLPIYLQTEKIFLRPLRAPVSPSSISSVSSSARSPGCWRIEPRNSQSPLGRCSSPQSL